MLGVQIFQLYGNLLTDEAHQPWEKIVKAQTDTIPREDLRGEVHEEKAGKTWTSFLEWVTFHLQSVFHPNAAEAVKFYITNTLKKPNRVPIWQFFVRVEQLNSYLENLPSLFQSPKANSATKPVMLLEDADLTDAPVANVPCQVAEAVRPHGELHSGQYKGLVDGPGEHQEQRRAR